MRRLLAALMVLATATALWGAGQIGVTGYPARPMTLKGGTGINIGADGTFTATGSAVVEGAIPFANLSSAMRGKHAQVGAASDSAFRSYTSIDRVTLSQLNTGLAGKSAVFGNQTTLAKIGTQGSNLTYAGYPVIPNLALVATTGDYDDLSGKPTLSTVAGTGAYSDLTGKPTLSTVATSGSYADLADKPTIPAAQVNSDWNAASGVAKINNKPNLATVATTGSYTDLTNKPATYTLPTASTTVKGGVKVDGTTIQVDGDGVISSTVSAGVNSFGGRGGDVMPAEGDYEVSQITGLQTALDAKLPITTFAAYTSVDRLTKDNPTYTGTLSSTSADGTKKLNVRNTVPYSGTPSTGDCQYSSSLSPAGWYCYNGSAWALSPTPPATANTLGGVKPGPTLTVDGDGVLDVMISSLGPSGLITAGLAGDQTISAGMAYVVTATGRWTFGSYSSTKQTTIFANYSGTLYPATGSKLYWANPITFANNSGAAAKIPAGARVNVQMLGGKTYATSTRNLQKVVAAAEGGGTYTSKPAYGSGYALNTAHSLSQGLVGAWLYNETTGLAHNLVDGATGTVTGTLGWSADGRTAASRGNNNEAHTVASFNRNNYSVHAVVKWDGTTGDSEVWNAGSTSALLKGLNTGNKWQFIAGGAAATSTSNKNTSPTTVTGTTDGSTTTIYVNGTAEGTTSTAVTSSAYTSSYAFGTSSISFPGEIRLLYLYNRPLTAGEVTALNTNPYQILQ